MTENESEKSSVKFELNDNDDMSDEIKKELNETGEVHLHKTGDDGEEVDIDINKTNKKIEVNIDKEGNKKKVNIGLSGIKVESEDGKNVNIKFLPIILVLAVFIFGVLFFFYKIIELIISSF